MSEDARPPITTTNLVTAAVAVVVVGVAVVAAVLMPAGIGTISDLEHAVWTAHFGHGAPFTSREVLAPYTLTSIHRDRLAEDVESYLSRPDADPDLAEPLREAIHDLLRKNDLPWPIEPRFPEAASIRILPVEDWKRLTADGMWSLTKLKETCPGVSRVREISRVGFDRRGLMALVARRTGTGSMASSGAVVLYRWDGKGWVLVTGFAGWTS